MYRTRIKEFRAKKNWKQEDLAQRVGVVRETISKIEVGKYNLSLLLAYKISKELESSIEEIFIFETQQRVV